MSFSCRFVTPERTLFEADALSFTLPTEAGEVTILAHHEPMTSVLVPGIARYTDVSHKEHEVAISSGFLQIDGAGHMTVLAEDAERGDELDLQTIAEAKARAQQIMKDAINRNDVAYTAAAAALQRELIRERLAVKYKHHRKTFSTEE